uniref:Uncharacterized protein n=1 Tax=Lactuca sativa TaxID=4236 RepID=A0A9R1WYY1_LACSA|nr:hypothetical protein LSAT_V11C800451130 [Lactuca sativa]
MDKLVLVQDQDSTTIEIEDNEITNMDSNSDPYTEEAILNYWESILNYWQSGIFTDNNQLMLDGVEEETNAYVNVEKIYINGKRNFQYHAVGIHKKNYKWNVMDEVREEAFWAFEAPPPGLSEFFEDGFYQKEKLQF